MFLQRFVGSVPKSVFRPLPLVLAIFGKRAFLDGCRRSALARV